MSENKANIWYITDKTIKAKIMLEQSQQIYATGFANNTLFHNSMTERDIMGGP